MKAKDYIARYKTDIENGNTQADVISVLVVLLSRDALEIAITRTRLPKPSTTALLGALREQEQKWRTIATACELNPNAYRDFLAEQGVHL